MKLLDWLEHRTGLRSLVRHALYENIPGGSRWRYVWGSTLVFTFAVQMITGIFLWMAYSPSSHTAWESVYYIQHEMAGGWLLRGLHHYTANAMVVLLALHLLQVVIDGAYKAPREINFWLGLVLMLIVLALALTGYLLPWDQKGYWATSVATNLMVLMPGVGQDLHQIVVGGAEYGHQTLTRFFALHAGLLPGLLIVFLVAHVALFRRHGITARMPPRRGDQYFWPDQVLKDAVACLAVLAIVLLLTIHFDVPALFRGELSGETAGASLGSPADGANPYDARPEWYFLFLFQMLKYFPGKLEIIGAIVIPGLVFLLLALMPFFGRGRLGHRFNVAFLCAILLAVVLLTGMAVFDDYYAVLFPNGQGERFERSKDFLVSVEEAEREAERVKTLVRSPPEIPLGGALGLLRDDPKTQGPRLFQLNCVSCHAYADPAGKDLQWQMQPEKPSAPNLYRFASREWIAGLLDPKQITGPNYFGNTKHRGGDMATYVKGDLQELWKPTERTAAIATLSAEAHLKSQLQADEQDKELIAQGKKLIMDEERCAQCHKFHEAGELGVAPDLTGYGSREWMLGIISNPAHPRFYGERNDRMPAFAEDPNDPTKNQLTPKELELIVDWLRGEWFEPE